MDLLGDSLVRLANEKGTKDNASAVAIEVMREGYVEDIWRAHEKDRIYVGYRSRPLRLNKPEDHLETHHPERTGNRMRVVLALVILIGIIWGISALNTRQQNLAIAALTTTPTPTATLIPPTTTLLPTIAVSSTPLANIASPTPPDLSITGTPPPLSSASRIDPHTEQSS